MEDPDERAQAVLLTFADVKADEFTRALDASRRIARQVAADQVDAAASVGKMLNYPLTKLGVGRRVGIVFTPDQNAEIKRLHDAGDLVGAQRLILDEIDRQVA